MNVLIIGQNTKIAKLFSYFCDKIYMVVDASVANFRAYKENASYNLIETSTDIKKMTSVMRRSHEICRWINEYSIDVVFTNEKISMVAAKLATFSIGRKVKLISTSHNSYAWTDPAKVRYFTKLINLCTDGYVALASFVSDLMCSFGFPEAKVLTLHNIIEPGLFEIKQSYDILPDKIKIVYTSTIYKGKGQHTILSALKQLLAKDYSIKIDFIGDVIDNDYKAELDRFIDEHNLNERVNFLGRVENHRLRQILHTYDIYVCPSLLEMSPYNVLEAKAAAMPIVATKVGGIPDMITDNVNGLLVEPENVGSMVSAIERLVSDMALRQSLGMAAASDMTEAAIRMHAGKFEEFVCKTA